MREKNSLGRMSVPVKIVLRAVQEHEVDRESSCDSSSSLPSSATTSSPRIATLATAISRFCNKRLRPEDRGANFCAGFVRDWTQP